VVRFLPNGAMWNRFTRLNSQWNAYDLHGSRHTARK
jgi:hypothetical protein